MTFYSLILIIIGFYFLLFSYTNIWFIRKKTHCSSMTNGPLVSVLIPARNEEMNIEKCVRSLIYQTYSNYEIIVLDDSSTDNTPIILRRLVQEFPNKLRVIPGKPLPNDWTGKSFAMQQLVENANGEYLLFTDSDTVHTNKSVSFAITNLIESNTDMISGYISQKMDTIGEKLVIPIIYILTMVVLPIWANQYSKSSIFASAIGQYIAVKAESFKGAGAYYQVQNKTTEDVFLARSMKKQGYSVLFVDAKEAAICRMYESYSKAVNGISKNIFDFIGRSNVILILAVVAIFLFLFLPAPLLITSIILHFITGSTFTVNTVSLIFNVICVLLMWINVCHFQKQPLYIAFLYPILFFSLLYTAIISWIRSKKGTGYKWKGRIVH